MIDADADPSHVGGRIIDTIGIRLPQHLIHEVIHANRFGFALGPPFAAAILEVADALLFFVSTETTG